MSLHGRNWIGGQSSAESKKTFAGFDPARNQKLEPPFHEASVAEIDRAFDLARLAFPLYRKKSPEERAAFLERIAEELLALGDEWIHRARDETGLPEARLTGERGRTIGQLKMFASLVREGSWVDARIDRADPARKPLPKPDVRRLLTPIGPVAVFGASNFPFAFSVAGGDTASALAAGNPVVVKAHPAHPGTSELAGAAISRAAEKSGIPAGAFSLLHGTSHDMGLHVVRHPAARAVAFTGSLRGGRALFYAGTTRPEPIPVYAEMGSINPVFVLPGALRERAEEIAAGLHQSVTLGVGQFCTNPGLVVGKDDPALARFLAKLKDLIAGTAPGTMLHPGIRDGYETLADRLGRTDGVSLAASSSAAPDAAKTQAAARLFTTTARAFLETPSLGEEVFGPSTLVVSCGARAELEAIARDLQGHLTATIHGSAEDLREHAELVSILETRVGRLVFNAFPTGVEVCAAMQHGGPYPATTCSQFTSVGTAAILRFVRPVCYQGWPQSELPLELRDANERKLWRLVDGQMTREGF